MTKIRGFEKVTKYNDEDVVLPFRATKRAAGYDMTAAYDIIIPPIDLLKGKISEYIADNFSEEEMSEYLSANAITDTDAIIKMVTKDLTEMKKILKACGAKPTLVSTGVKAYMQDDEVLHIILRSGLPLNSLLILANSIGEIDADYYNNADNEGEIFFQLINTSPLPVMIKKGDRIGQGEFTKFLLTDNDANQEKSTRESGLGSTGRR